MNNSHVFHLAELVTHLRVTHESKHHRNITCFGPTTLRSTICYNMLRLASPKPGDVIIDPMCGGGSIPIEVLYLADDGRIREMKLTAFYIRVRDVSGGSGLSAPVHFMRR